MLNLSVTGSVYTLFIDVSSDIKAFSVGFLLNTRGDTFLIVEMSGNFIYDTNGVFNDGTPKFLKEDEYISIDFILLEFLAYFC